jgi:hypothetical protein
VLATPTKERFRYARSFARRNALAAITAGPALSSARGPTGCARNADYGRRLKQARAQQAGRLPTIGFLGANTSAPDSQWLAVFAQRLRDLRWVENRTVAIEVRWGEGRSDRFTA